VIRPVDARATGLFLTVDSILQEIIDERKDVREEKIKSGAENVDENLVGVHVLIVFFF
jgi:hypothetical protein